MKPFGKLVPRIEAVRIIDENVRRTARVEVVPLEEASGAVLAETLVAGFDVPPFDRSAMDGYAVRAEDIAGASEKNPVRLRVIGTVHAGEPFGETVLPNTCVEIATGGPMPLGADAVVMVEYTRLDGLLVEVQKEARLGDNVAPRGEDIQRGEIVVREGEQLTPGKLGAAAALGLTSVRALSKPWVAIYSTGTEVVAQGQPLGEGQIYDINSFTLEAVIAANGCVPIRKGLIKDDPESLLRALREAATYDMAVFSGGSSVGARDLFAEIVMELGRIHFHGLQVKPGKPTLFGEVMGTPMFGMPGNPTSCLSNAYVFLAPALRKMAGLPPAEPRSIKVRLKKGVHGDGEREQFYTVRLDEGRAVPVFKQSGDITSMAHADGYIIIPIGTRLLEEGAEVTVYLFG